MSDKPERLKLTDEQKAFIQSLYDELSAVTQKRIDFTQENAGDRPQLMLHAGAAYLGTLLTMFSPEVRVNARAYALDCVDAMATRLPGDHLPQQAEAPPEEDVPPVGEMH